ncbi:MULTISPECIES: sialidase family protein [unclassified Rhizobium]|uniref:sialidase family protein n=1 Tax=unclassified Rhizobium TaxID=2613769 RepID=UPI000EAA4D47|nr:MULTISPECIES: sialidase family protein [unclassified Rhizobium]AYG69037.1 exo-alpha-sialidase [Rhizobium sp. CCGE531]AYG75417.1 exo-alpha-sialidase [Rhizobium sp. CCGE532]
MNAPIGSDNWAIDALVPDSSNAFGLSNTPAVAVYRNKLYCVRQGRGGSGWVWCATFDGNSWSADELIKDQDNAYGISGSPALAVFRDKLYCVRQGRDSSGWVWCATFDGNSWSDDRLIPSNDDAYGISGSPALAVFNDRLYCVHQGRGDSGWLWCATFDGNSWSADQLIPSADSAYGLSGSPALAVYNGKLYCARQGRENSGWVWCASFDGSTWSNDQLIPTPGNAYGVSDSPALAVFQNKLYCLRQGRGGSGWIWGATFDGNTWTNDRLIPSPDNAYGISASPALVVYNNQLYCFHQGRHDDGWLWCGSLPSA